MDADGSHVRSLGLAGRHPSWSPDGTKVAFVATDDPEYGCGSVRITEVDGPGYVALPSPGCYVHDPNWSPDGKRIAFSSSRGMNTLDQGIFVVNADGSGLKRLSPVWEGSEPRAMLTPTWSPDGKRIAYMFDPDGSNYPSATRYYCRRIGNGPQTGWADCRPPGPLPGQITVMNADGSDAHQLTQGGSPDFSSG
jgi:Tol biopolymer transport system component